MSSREIGQAQENAPLIVRVGVELVDRLSEASLVRRIRRPKK